jgi:hypothetical protein
MVMSLTKILGKVFIAGVDWVAQNASGGEEDFLEALQKDPYFESWGAFGGGVAGDMGMATTGILIGAAPILTLAGMAIKDPITRAITGADEGPGFVGNVQEWLAETTENAAPARTEMGGAGGAIYKTGIAISEIIKGVQDGKSIGDMKRSTIMQALAVSKIPAWMTKTVWTNWEALRDNTDMFQ